MKFLFLFLLSSGFSLAETHIVNGCMVYGSSGDLVRPLPGSHCLFFDNGSFVSAGDDGLKLFDQKFNIRWTLPGHFHHQLNFDYSKRRILALSSSIVAQGKEKLRADRFLVVGLDGKILLERDSASMLKEVSLPGRIRSASFLIDGSKIEKELSHFNSFYEVPPQDADSTFKAGTFIVNSLSLGIFILSPDLSKIIKRLVVKNSVEHSIHDVQIRANGNLLLFNNEIKAGDQVWSAVQELNPDQQVVSEFTARPKEVFYSRFAGNVQELKDGSWFFAHMYTGAYRYDPTGSKDLRAWPGINIYSGALFPSQQVKTYDLRKFFSHAK